MIKSPRTTLDNNDTNHNYYSDTSVRILTYERGVEDYTLACGTGCGSTAATLWTQGKLPGGKLTLETRVVRCT